MKLITRKIIGYMLLSVPTIIYGGYFLLTVLSKQQEHLALTDFQKSMFRAGHAHAGVMIILSLIALQLVDSTVLGDKGKWVVRLTFPFSSIFISGGFFAAAIGNGITQPTGLIALLYAGIVLLVTGLVTLALGFIRAKE
jgi:hypothetical protein